MSRILGVVVCLIILVASPARPAQSATAAVEFPGELAEVRVDAVRGGPYLFVPVKINDRDAGLFLVDTNASHVMLSTVAAQALDLPRVGGARPEVSAVGGKASSGGVCIIDAISIGGVVVRRTLATEVDLSAISKELGTDRLAGFLGGDFLRRMPFTIDFPAGQLVLHDPRRFTPPAHAKRHELALRDFCPLVDVTLERKVTAPFFVDTGQNSEMLVQSLFAQMYPKLLVERPSRQVLIVGMGGVRQVRSTDLNRVELLGTTFENVPADYSFDDRIAASGYGAGSVGVDLLWHGRLTLDYAGGGAWYEHDAAAVPAEWSEADFDPRQPDLAGVTPLMRAIQLGADAFVERFIAAGVDVNAKGPEGHAALSYAVRYNRPTAARALIEKRVDVDVVADSDGKTVLLVAAAHASGEIVELLLKAGAKMEHSDAFGRTALMMAAYHGNLPTTDALIRAGADVNAQSHAAGGALHVAAFNGYADVTAKLLAAGADANLAIKKSGETPLAVAANTDAPRVVELLIRHGADVNARDTDGDTPMHLAAAKGRTAMADLLVAAGADPAARNNQNKSPLDIAAQFGRVDVAERLLRRLPAAAGPTTTTGPER